MKVITKDYLENTLKNYTTEVVDNKTKVTEVDELPSSPSNTVYNVTTKELKDETMFLDWSEFETIVRNTWKLIDSYTNDNDVSFELYMPIKPVFINNKEIYSVWWNDSSEIPRIKYVEENNEYKKYNSDFDWNDNVSRWVNFGRYHPYYWIIPSSGNYFSFKEIMESMIGTGNATADQYILYPTENMHFNHTLDDGEDDKYIDAYTELVIQKDSSGNYIANISNWDYDEKRVSSNSATKFAYFDYCDESNPRSSYNEYKTVYSKDVKLNRASVDCTADDYATIISNGTIASDKTYYITDEEGKASITVDGTYSATSTNAQSGKALKTVMDNLMTADTNQSISGTKSFSKIKVGNCTITGTEGVLTFAY